MRGHRPGFSLIRSDMKTSPLLLLSSLGALLLATACSHLDLMPESDPDRVLKGTVNFRADLTLPPDTVVVVRLIDPAGRQQTQNAANRDLPIVAQSKAETVPQVIAEQTIRSPAVGAIPFQLNFHADESLLRHGLNLDVRVSYDGRVRYRTVNARLVTLSNVNISHEIWVETSGP